MSRGAGSARRGAALQVAVADARGRALGGTGLERWLARAAPRALRGQVAIALVSDAAMRRLNRQYRGIDRPTDVLAFPAGPAPALHSGRTAPASGRTLGDIAIARGVAARQARRLGHSERVEWRVLALHGLLHLLGYDHERDRGEMQRLEDRLRRRAGLPAGLMARRLGALAR